MRNITMDRYKEIKKVYENEEIQTFISEFKHLRLKYIAGMEETVTKLKILNEDFKLKYEHSPIDNIESRIKSIDSLVNKMIKNDVPFDIDSLEKSIFDIAGVRIVCSFISDIFHIARMIQDNEDIEVLMIKDYVKNPKKSGYRSYHMLLKVPVYLTTGREDVIVELQIRTMAMDFWASLEHNIKYKYDGIIPSDVENELIECSNAIYESDIKMMHLKERIKEVNNK